MTDLAALSAELAKRLWAVGDVSDPGAYREAVHHLGLLVACNSAAFQDALRASHSEPAADAVEALAEIIARARRCHLEPPAICRCFGACDCTAEARKVIAALPRPEPAPAQLRAILRQLREEAAGATDDRTCSGIARIADAIEAALPRPAVAVGAGHIPNEHGDCPPWCPACQRRRRTALAAAQEGSATTKKNLVVHEEPCFACDGQMRGVTDRVCPHAYCPSRAERDAPNADPPR